MPLRRSVIVDCEARAEANSEIPRSAWSKLSNPEIAWLR